MTKKRKKTEKGEFFHLRYIAFCRSKLFELSEGYTMEVLGDFARHQICKVKNIAFLDPVWDNYTTEDLLVEYFAILFDENEEATTDFLKLLKQSKEDEVMDFFERMEKKHQQKIQAEATKAAESAQEFEDTFG